MADDLGKRLLAEIEDIGLDEILYGVQLRSQDAFTPIPYFGLAALDAILHATRPPATARADPSPPIIELTSTSPGGGTTHVLYHLCAIATLPRTYGGKQASVVLVDADNTFSISRLAQQLAYQIKQLSPSEDHSVDVERTVLDSLTHIHVLRPQSLASTIASLRALPAYLFDPRKHHSFDRAVAFLALDSATAFSWQARAATAAATESDISTSSNTLESYATLAQTLQDYAKQLACPLILTAHLLYPLPLATGYPTQNVIRPTLPGPMSALPTLRLIVRRVHVRKFPAGISASEARREAADRQRAVDAGRFECVVNEWGMDGERMRGLRGARSRFEFRITGHGVMMEGGEAVKQQKQGEEFGEVG